MQNQRSISSSSFTRSASSAPLKSEMMFEEREQRILDLKKKFWWFSTIASLNHALNYVVNAFATSVLSHRLGGTILGLSWTLNSVSGLTVATAAVRSLGFKYSMIISLWGYTIQIATLYWAIKTPDVVEAWIIAIVGSAIAGFTSAIWWTAQGVYFEHVCLSIDKVSSSYGSHNVSNIDNVRADLSAHWTIVYQLADIVVFLSLSIFPITGFISVDTVILCLCFLGITTSLLGFTFESVEGDGNEISWKAISDAIVAVPIQYKRDARVTLLAPFVFGFGITTAMFAYYVNSSAVSDSSSLGTVSLGFLEAFSYLVAVISAIPYAYISNNFIKGQDWVIQFGSLAFLSSAVVVAALPSDKLGSWQYILIAKGLYGLGRGVFEGSCRAVYAAMFTGNDLSTAFSGQTLSAGFSGGICFFLFGILSRTAIAGVAIINGIVAILAYFILMYVVDPTKPLPWSQLLLCKEGEKRYEVTDDDWKESASNPLLGLAI